MNIQPSMTLAARLYALSAQDRTDFVLRLLEKGGSLSSLPIAQLNETTEAPLSFEQQRLAVLDHLEPESCDYLLYQAFRVPGLLDAEKLRQVFTELVEEHSALRTQINFDLTQSKQKHCNELELPFVVHKLAGEEFEALLPKANNLIRQAIPLGRAPLFRVDVIENSGRDRVLLFRIHHIVADGISLSLLFQSALTKYEALVAGRTTTRIKNERASLADFATWQHMWADGVKQSNLGDAWLSSLHTAPTQSTLPADITPFKNEYIVPEGRLFRSIIDSDLAEDILQTSRDARVGQHAIFVAAHALTLRVLSGQERFIIGSPASGRVRPEIEQTVGFFATTNFLDVDLTESTTFSHVLERASQAMHQAEQLKSVPFEMLREKLTPIAAFNKGPLFQTFLISHSTEKQNAFKVAGQDWQLLELHNGSCKFDITLELTPFNDGFECLIEYDATRYSDKLIQTYVEIFTHMLAAIARYSNDEMQTVSLPVQVEMQQQLDQLNHTSVTWPEVEQTLSIIERQFNKQAQRIALCSDAGSWTYAELDRASAQIASSLLAQDVQAGDAIAVELDREAALIAVLLGIWRVGAVYVPLDPKNSIERTNTIVSLAKPKLMISRNIHDHITCLNPDDLYGDHIDCSFNQHNANGTEVAYIIFTSGSTGTPKGVCVTHDNLKNFLRSMAEKPGLSQEDRLLSVTTPGFDISLLEFLLPLTVGATLELASSDIVSDVFALRALIEQSRPTVMQATPSLWHMLINTGWRPHSTLRILAGGEPMPLSLARTMLESAQALWNMYGPTETTIWSLCEQLTLPLDTVCIGHPIANTEIRIVDPQGRLVPIGVTGELWIGGMGVASGYQDLQDLTIQNFITLNTTSKSRWYRTGDHVRMTHAGQIIFVGRKDDQLKIRGHRVELGEIEAILMKNPYKVRVVVRAQEQVENTRLVAYVETLESSQSHLSSAQMAQFATDVLPDYMRPSSWRFTPSFPRNSAGKIDRKALDKLDCPDEVTSHQFDLPQGNVEQCLAKMLMALLNIDEIDRNADFFVLGGNSMVAVEYLMQIHRKLAVKPQLKVLLENPTVASMARYIKAHKKTHFSEKERPEKVPSGQNKENIHFPLTDVQRAYWSGRQVSREGASVSSYIYQEFESTTLELHRLESALNKLIQRQSMLRAIVTEDGQQKILSQVTFYKIECDDLSSVAEHSLEALLLQKRTQLKRGCQSTETWPLFELQATKLPNGALRLHFGIDLLIADAASLNILAEELFLLYEGEDEQLPILPISFQDYVLQDQSELHQNERNEAEQWWDEQISHFPAGPDLPVRTELDELSSLNFCRRSHVLSASSWAALRQLARNQRVSATSLLLSIFSLILTRWSQQLEFSLNLTVFNRPRMSGADALIGDFTDILLLPISTEKQPSLRKLALQIQNRLWQSLDNSALSGVRVSEKLIRSGRIAAPLPVVFTSLLDQASSINSGIINALDIQTVYTISQTPQVWLDHQVMEREGKLYLNWDAVEELFEPAMLDEMFAAYIELIEELALNPSLLEATNLPRLPAVATAIQRCALPTSGLHDALANYARETPHATAIWQANAAGECLAEISYDQLNRAANRVAITLQSGGVVQEEIIAIVMEKGWEQSAAAHGILKSGGAYLPIDPGLPKQRQQELLTIAQVRHILTQPQYAADLVDLPQTVHVVSSDWQSCNQPFEAKSAHPEQTAYVIFTSGSTGTPKGVVISHQAVMNTIEDICTRRELTETDGVFGLSSLSFDLSVFDLFGTTARGARLVLPHPEGLKDPRHWERVLQAGGVTVWNSVPALLRMLTIHEQDRSGVFPQLRVAMLSGDWIPLSLPEDAWQSLNREMKIYSLGGATEASIWSIEYEIESVDKNWQSIPYGIGLTNQPMRVMTAGLQECPVGVVGEIVIGGDGLAQGYLGRKDLTEKSFVIHPETEERLYKTGDLGRYDRDGVIEFLGRIDNQVKINGHRVELGEVEAVLEKQPSIAQAVAVVNQAMLAAFVVQQSNQLPSQTELDSWMKVLKSTLPEYMVPNILIPTEAVLMTNNGKIDRKALGLKAELAMQSSAPASDLQISTNAYQGQLSKIVADILNRERVGLDDNFFDMGGGSIEIVLIHRALEKHFGIEVPITELFRLGTIRGVADYLSSRENPACKISKIKTQAKIRSERRKVKKRRRAPCNEA
ncbi:amino acid adenylation domain-containing protein [Vibrio parahaemolyticus]|nr:amino acid adenylation domain-containing protein [Vibrio parahaemolyticus]